MLPDGISSKFLIDRQDIILENVPIAAGGFARVGNTGGGERGGGGVAGWVGGDGRLRNTPVEASSAVRCGQEPCV